MSFICMKMDLQVKHIFMRTVSHLDSFWHRGKPELGNGLLSISAVIKKESVLYMLTLMLISPRCTLAFSCFYACAYAYAYFIGVNHAYKVLRRASNLRQEAWATQAKVMYRNPLWFNSFNLSFMKIFLVVVCLFFVLVVVCTASSVLLFANTFLRYFLYYPVFQSLTKA